MDDFIQMHVFFFITTVVVILLGGTGAVALYYLARILKNLDRLTKNITDESEIIREDIAELREKAKDEGVRIAHIIDFFSKVSGRDKAHRKRSEKK
jgi:hypothetical protein